MKRSLRSWIWRIPIDQEVDGEIAFHVEMRTRELIASGMDPETARETAIRRFGDAALLKQTCVDLGRKRDRDMRRTQWLEELRDDVKFGLRQLRRSPAFALVAVATLALGIGANSAIFALVDATLLRPLPYPNPDRLVMIAELSATSRRSGIAPRNLLDWGERTHSFDRLAGFIPAVGGVVMAGADGTAENISRQWVGAGVFEVLGVTPVAGRTFLPADVSQRASVVVLSEPFWRTRFNGDRSLLGRDIRLDGEAYTVVGVVPQGFELPGGQSSIWALDPRPVSRTQYYLRGIGRMKPGVTLEAARSDLAAAAAQLAADFSDTNKGRGVVVEAMHDALIGSELRLTAMLFLAVVGFVLLICCANVANLLLARATVRGRELATRSALGAGRRRLVRQLLTESLVLSSIGGVLGVGVGAAILKIAPAVIPAGLLPGAVTLTFDSRVVLFCAAATVLVGLFFGLAPAWKATDLAAAEAIASARRTTTGSSRLRSLLVVGEVATAVLLLFGAGLLLRTLIAVDTVDRGYGADQALTMMVDPLGSRYPTPESLLQFFDNLGQEVAAVPGVKTVAWASGVPMGPSAYGSLPFDVVGDPPIDPGKRPTADFQIVSANYFKALDLPIIAGRSFDADDRREGVRVCIVNEAFVRSYLGGRSPVGMRIVTGAGRVTREIVGVARQMKGRPDEAEGVAQIYGPIAQDPFDDMYLIVRPSSGDAAALAPSVRAAIGRIDKEQLVSVREVLTLEDLAREATSRHRFRALMVMAFATLALLLAMVGVFGILAYAVQQRSREFGVRLALGASLGDVLRLVVGGAARLIAAGTVIGLILAAVLGRLLASVLFGVQPLDPLTFVGVAMVLVVAAVAATAAPALRAARIDPAVALRSE